MASEMRKFIDIVDQYNKMERVLLSITTLGDGFKNKGAIINHSSPAKDVYYVIAGAEISEEIIEKCEGANTDDERVAILIEKGILGVISVNR